MSDLAVIGATLTNEELEVYRDWILEKDRDLELQSFHLGQVLDDDWQPMADHIKALLAGYRGRLGIHGPFWGFSVATSDTLVQEVVRKRLGQGLDVCAAVGATQMVMNWPFKTRDYHNLEMMAGQRDRLFTNTHAVLDPIVKRAEDMGVVLVMENIEDIAPADRKLLCESFASPALQLSIDTGYAQYAHGSTGAPPVDYFMRSADEMLNHIHLQDANGYADRHWAIGEGSILWASVFAAIGALTVKPRLILELRDKAGIPASMAYLAAHGLRQ